MAKKPKKSDDGRTRVYGERLFVSDGGWEVHKDGELRAEGEGNPVLVSSDYGGMVFEVSDLVLEIERQRD